MTANAHHFHPLTPFVMQQTGPSYQSFVNVFLCLATGFWHFPLRIAGKKKKKENKRSFFFLPWYKDEPVNHSWNTLLTSDDTISDVDNLLLMLINYK